MLTAMLAVHNGVEERIVNLDAEQLEWILNSLRLMQEEQQELATKHAGETLTKEDVVEALNASGDLGKGRDWEVPEGHEGEAIDLSEMFREQFADVTTLRESIVEACGRDMTDVG